MRTTREMGGQSIEECESEGENDNESTEYRKREGKH